MPVPAQPPANFVEILKHVWWRLDRALDRDSLRASARLYAAEAVEHGTAAVIDHHESPDFIEGSLDVVADACQEMGLRAVVCYGATERNAGRDEARRGLEECRRFIRQNTRPLVRGIVGLHAPFTVSDDTLRDAADLAHELASVLHVHVAEDGIDVQDARERGYSGVIDRLERLGAMVPGSIFAHGVHLTPDEVRKCDQLGCWLVQNPRSNEGNRVGYPRALAHSNRVALGSDGYPSNMEDEQRALLAHARSEGESTEDAGRRLWAGRQLIAERFAGETPGAEPARSTDEARAAVASLLPGIRQDAHRQAPGLWARMRAIGDDRARA
jgi:cytosine/adenosine deaminase-related metal-dependent hydrolase